jgi:hypothetical protein
MGIEMDRTEAMCNLTPPLRIFVSAAAKKYLDSSLKTGTFEQTGPILLKVISTLHPCQIW